MAMSRRYIWICSCCWVALCAVLWGCAGRPFGDSEAGLALEDLAAGSGSSRLKAQTPQPLRRTVSITSADGDRSADLYLPPQGARAGIVLVPGVVARGGGDPRIVALADTLARLRIAVLVPDMPGVRRYQVRASDVQEVVAAFKWLAGRPDLAPPGHIGIAGFSYGAGPVLVAALQPAIREQVRFVLAVGGFHALQNVVSYFTTGYYDAARPAMPAAYPPPHPYIKWVFTVSNIELLERPADRAFLRSYADYIGANEESDAMLSAPALAPDAQAVFNLLTNPEPARVATLIEQLPVVIRHELEGVNPAAHDLSRMQARVILLHGRGDNFIPYAESLALADALPADRVQLFLIDGLAHVDLRPAAQDIPLLIDAMEALLAERVPGNE